MNQYDITVKYFNKDGTYHTTEENMYSIPFDPDNPNVFEDPKVKCEMGKTGTFEFSVYPGHPYYDCWLQMKTTMRVKLQEKTIFDGRVLNIETDRISGKRTVHGEGYLAYLMDSQVEGKSDNDREKISCAAYIDQLIENHNAQMILGGPTKHLTKGWVPGSYPDSLNEAQKIHPEDKKYGSSSWQDTASALNTITNEYGGFLRIRRSGNDHYLDILNSWFNDENTEKRWFRVADNVIALASTEEVDNIFTFVVPVGTKGGKNLYVKDYKYTRRDTGEEVTQAENYLRVMDIPQIYDDATLNAGYHTKANYVNSFDQYGVIYKVVSFPNADTHEKLWEYAWDWIKDNYNGGKLSFNCTAVDLSMLGTEGTEKILAGDRVKLTYRAPSGNDVTEYMTVISVEYDLHHPENTAYTIGKPDSAMNREYGEKKNSGGGGGGKKEDDTIRDPNQPKLVRENRDEVMEYFAKMLVSRSYNSKAYQAYVAKYGEDAGATLLQATAMALNDEIEKCGDYEIEDPRIELKRQGMHPMYFDSHAASLVTKRPPPEYVDLSKVDLSSQESIDTFVSSLTTTKLDGLRSLFTLLTQPTVDPENPEGEPDATVELDGSEEGNAKVGKNLTAQDKPWRTILNKETTYIGIDGEEHTLPGFVFAEDFEIKDSYPSLKTKLLVVDVLLADYAKIGTLEALEARVDDLEADAITTGTLSAAITDMGLLTVDIINASSAIGVTGPMSCNSLSVGGRSYGYGTATYVSDVTINFDAKTFTKPKKTIYFLGGTPSG